MPSTTHWTMLTTFACFSSIPCHEVQKNGVSGRKLPRFATTCVSARKGTQVRRLRAPALESVGSPLFIIVATSGQTI